MRLYLIGMRHQCDVLIVEYHQKVNAANVGAPHMKVRRSYAQKN